MIRQNTQDERVLALRRKINSEAFGIIMIVLLASILVQQFLLNAPFEQYAVETLCFFGMSIYMIARHMTLGLDIFDEEKHTKTIPVVNSIVAGITVTAINGVCNYAQYGESYQESGMGYFFAMLAITFISTALFTFAVLTLMKFLNKKKQAQIGKRLDDEENDNEIS
jgi:hypothetical protein